MNFERLESRQLFSVTAVQTGVVLRVTGDIDNDTVAVYEDDAGINVDGANLAGPFTGVKLVIVSLGDGADTLEFQLLTASLIAKGGSGDDLLLGSVGNGYDVALDGGTGSNFLTVSGDSTAGGLAIIAGGSNNDNISVTAFDKVIVDSGSGDDIIFVTGSNGLALNSGSGDDSVIIENATGTSVILGGSGIDTIVFGGNGNFIVLGGAGADSITNLATGHIVVIN